MFLGMKLYGLNQKGKVPMFENFDDILTVDEACKALKIGKNSMYKLLETNTLRSIKIGKKYIIPKLYLIDFINYGNYNDDINENSDEQTLRKEN